MGSSRRRGVRQSARLRLVLRCSDPLGGRYYSADEAIIDNGFPLFAQRHRPLVSGGFRILLALDADRHLAQRLLDVFLEMRRRAVRVQRGLIAELLVNEEACRIGDVPVHDEHHAPWFLSRFGGKFPEQTRGVCLTTRVRGPRDGQRYHTRQVVMTGRP